MYFRDEDISWKWDKATEKLYQEFGIAPSEIQQLSVIKILFMHYIHEYKLTETASVALYYRLVIYSMLITAKNLKKIEAKVTKLKLAELLTIYETSKQLANDANDYKTLNAAIRSINDTIDALLVDLG
jgi:hypothetical protein